MELPPRDRHFSYLRIPYVVSQILLSTYSVCSPYYSVFNYSPMQPYVMVTNSTVRARPGR
jgi:hypothetical protein